jgi:hypothetical protein
MEENIHPNTLMPPKAANAEGIRKTPDPIMLPTTSEVLVHKPSLFFGDEDAGMQISLLIPKAGRYDLKIVLHRFIGSKQLKCTT